MESGTELQTQRRLSNLERSHQADRILVAARRHRTRRAIQSRHGQGGPQGKPRNRSSLEDLLEEVFELNMQLEELRMNQENWGRRSALLGKELEDSQRFAGGQISGLVRRAKNVLERMGQGERRGSAKGPAKQDGGPAESPLLHPQSGKRRE